MSHGIFGTYWLHFFLFADSFRAPSLPLFLLSSTSASWSEGPGVPVLGTSHKFKPQRAAAPTTQPQPSSPQNLKAVTPPCSLKLFLDLLGSLPGHPQELLRWVTNLSYPLGMCVMSTVSMPGPKVDGSPSISGDDPNRRDGHNTYTKKLIVIYLKFILNCTPHIFTWQTINEPSSSRLFPLSHRWALQLHISKPCSKAGRGKKVFLLGRLGFFIQKGKLSPGISGRISLCECACGGMLAATEPRKLSVLTFHNRKNKG